MLYFDASSHGYPVPGSSSPLTFRSSKTNSSTVSSKIITNNRCVSSADFKHENIALSGMYYRGSTPCSDDTYADALLLQSVSVGLLLRQHPQQDLARSYRKRRCSFSWGIRITTLRSMEMLGASFCFRMLGSEKESARFTSVRYVDPAKPINCLIQSICPANMPSP